MDIILRSDRFRRRRRKTAARSPNGCAACRERHLKCDEGTPECERCRRLDRVCEYRHFEQIIPVALGGYSNHSLDQIIKHSKKQPANRKFIPPTQNVLAERCSLENLHLMFPEDMPTYFGVFRSYCWRYPFVLPAWIDSIQNITSTQGFGGGILGLLGCIILILAEQLKGDAQRRHDVITYVEIKAISYWRVTPGTTRVTMSLLLAWMFSERKELEKKRAWVCAAVSDLINSPDLKIPLQSGPEVSLSPQEVVVLNEQNISLSWACFLMASDFNLAQILPGLEHVPELPRPNISLPYPDPDLAAMYKYRLEGAIRSYKGIVLN